MSGTAIGLDDKCTQSYGNATVLHTHLSALHEFVYAGLCMRVVANFMLSKGFAFSPGRKPC